jgi:hypothetical protein
MQSKLARLLDPLYRWITNYMGDCGFILYGIGKDSAPPPPDYTALAKDTQQSNVDMARLGLAANRVNQNTPYGNLNYTQSGTDSYGNPTYTATQTLSPEQQNIYNKSSGLTSSLLDASSYGVPNVVNSLMKGGVDQSKLPSTGFNPGQSYQDAIMTRLAPQIDRENQSFEQEMANKGIGAGTSAYNTAKTLLGQNQNDRLNSATVSGLNAGLTANQQNFNQAQSNLTTPINLVNSLRTGSNVTNPTYANSTNMANVPGVDYTGAGVNQYNANLAQTNANNAATGNFFGGLMNLGGAALMSPTGTFSGSGSTSYASLPQYSSPTSYYSG